MVRRIPVFSDYTARFGAFHPARGMRESRASPTPAALRDPGIRMKSYMCVICGFIYDEAKGLPEQGIAPGTRWDDVPENFTCPDCGATKTDFEMVQV
jgi:rubredoxin